MPTYRFPCGCEWPILEGDTPEGLMPLLDFNVEEAPEDCPATWALLGRGLTKGVFQLESPLGRQWTKKLKPESGEHLGALGAILRPGCLQNADDEGVSTTQHYCRRKNNEEPVKYFHPALEPILNSTYGVMVYQEQAMAVAQVVAGFSLQDADVLRKAIGKKLPEVMAECKVKFIEGCKKVGILNEEEAASVFAGIQESQRYSFNKSHAICYGLTGYDCAYVKAHFPLAFFTAWLAQAKNKNSGGGPRQEIHELVNDARLFDVAVEPPDFRSPEEDFHTDRRVSRFGLSNIKGMGPALFAKVKDAAEKAAAELGKPAGEWSWCEFLIHFTWWVPASSAKLLVEVGALRWTGMGRQEMLAELSAWSHLTDKEREWVREQEGATYLGIKEEPFGDFREALRLLGRPKKLGGGCSNKNRVSAVTSLLTLLENPPSALVDTPDWVACQEEELLGIALTCTKVDACDISEVNTSCKEFRSGKTGYMVLGAVVEESREVKTRRGKTPGSRMGRLVLSDGTCTAEAVAFPEVWAEFGHLLSEGNCVILRGERETNNDYDSLIVKKVWQATADVIRIAD